MRVEHRELLRHLLRAVVAVEVCAEVLVVVAHQARGGQQTSHALFASGQLLMYVRILLDDVLSHLSGVGEKEIEKEEEKEEERWEGKILWGKGRQYFISGRKELRVQ